MHISIPTKVTVKILTYKEFKVIEFSADDKTKRLVIEAKHKPSLDLANRSLSIESKDLILQNNIKKAIIGLTDGFVKNLSLTGTGFKAISNKAKPTSQLIISIGFSHDVKLDVPTDIDVTCPNATTIIIKGSSHQEISQFAHKIVALKPAYKDKYKKIGVVCE